MSTGLVALLAALLLATVFLFPLPRQVIDERRPVFRSFVSLAAGVGIAYVFIDLLPELSAAAEEFVARPGALGLEGAEYTVHLTALFGFFLFYGLERLVRWTRGGAGPSGGESVERAEASEEGEKRADYAIKVTGIAGYVWLIAYLMSRGFLGEGEEGNLYYVVAMVFHFIALRHSVRYEYPGAYDRSGRWIFGLACLAGWGMALAMELPIAVETLLLGFLGGMLIMNTTVMELPTEKEGRFGAFAAGALLYAALLIAA